MNYLTTLQQFRSTLYNSIPARRDASMNLLDALCADGHRAKSVVELSESRYFERQYSSITEAIADGLTQANWSQIKQLIYDTTQPALSDRVVMVGDCTANKRPFSDCLSDRGIIHSPNPAPGNKPICVGHQYSVIGILPDASKDTSNHWMIPLCAERVSSKEKGHEVGMKQFSRCIDHCSLSGKLVITVADSAYGTEACRKTVSHHDNWVHVFRLNSTRNVYALASNDSNMLSHGNKKRYDNKMTLNDASTHRAPDATEMLPFTTRSGRRLFASIQTWRNQIVRGSRQFKGYEHPMSIMRIKVYDEKGKPVCRRPLWLAIAGKRREEVSAKEACLYYRRRYDIQHFFRFGKDKLLLASSLTPDVNHPLCWWNFVLLAYVQLYLAKESVTILPRKWERYLPIYKSTTQDGPRIATPSQTQRDFGLVLDEIGTPAKDCRPRGNPKGRVLGDGQAKRKRYSPEYFINFSVEKI